MKKALVVGIDHYPTSPLHGCINDASSIATLIETHGDGAPNFEVKLETNVPTKSKLRSLIKDLFSGDCDSVLFYFSGHGYLNDLGGYLVTPDYANDDEGVPMDDVLAFANLSKSRDKIIIFDCCHSGSMGNTKFIRSSSILNEGVTILTASRDYESAVEINGHGVFSNLLLDALQGGAADLRGHISPGGVYAFIDQALGAHDQRPVFKTNISQFTSIRQITPQVTISTLRTILEYFPTPQDTYKLDPSYEDTNSLDVTHSIIEPYANPTNVTKFKNLQKLQSIGLVVPVDADFMYFAAMESKSCRLTALGFHYWQLVKDKRI